MATLIKNNTVSNNPWIKVELTNPAEATDYSILPMEDILEIENFYNKKLAGCFNTDIDIGLFTEELLTLPMLCIEVSDFNDGRIFSLASIIRQQLNYSGDLRIAGNIITDQLPQLKFCGFSSFLLPDKSVDLALSLLNIKPYSSRFRSTN